MKYKGMHFRRSNTLLWRAGDPARDVDGYGMSVQSNYCTIVHVKDCINVSANIYDTSNAPAYKTLTYSQTNLGRDVVVESRVVGEHPVKMKTRHNPEMKYAHTGTDYVVYRYYLVYDNVVYTAIQKIMGKF